MRGAPAFDRRVPGPLLDALGSRGAFAWVADYGRSPLGPGSPPLDLGLRAWPKKPGTGLATLYLGTTQVLGVEVKADGLFRLKSHQHGGLFGDVDPPFDPAWRPWQPLEGLVAVASDVRRHVAAAIERAPKGRQSEGFFQAALSKQGTAEYALVDREVTLTFATTSDKKMRLEQLRAPLVAVRRSLADQHRWAERDRHTRPGDKLDALAIDSEGRLLAIEIKPGSETNGLGWTPLQVAMYVRLLRAWTEVDQERARDVLEGMAHQRGALGLSTGAVPRLRVPIEVVPVIAVGKPTTNQPEACLRFEIVRAELRRHDEPLHDLRLWAIAKTGELSDTDAVELDERFQ